MRIPSRRATSLSFAMRQQNAMTMVITSWNIFPKLASVFQKERTHSDYVYNLRKAAVPYEHTIQQTCISSTLLWRNVQLADNQHNPSAV